jgi:hypothetical protein
MTQLLNSHTELRIALAIAREEIERFQVGWKKPNPILSRIRSALRNAELTANRKLIIQTQVPEEFQLRGFQNVVRMKLRYLDSSEL